MDKQLFVHTDEDVYTCLFIYMPAWTNYVNNSFPINLSIQDHMVKEMHFMMYQK